MALPILSIQPIMDFTQVVQDTFADTAVTVFRPNAPSGWYIFGDYCQTGTQGPLSPGFVVQVSNDNPASPALAAPTGWTFITTGATENPDLIYLCWAPVAPQGYVGCGHVWTTFSVPNSGYAPPPDIPSYRCLNANLAKTYPLTTLIWDDHGSGCNYDTSCWSIAPLGTFFVWPQNGVTPTVPAYIPTQAIPLVTSKRQGGEAIRFSIA